MSRRLTILLQAKTGEADALKGIAQTGIALIRAEAESCEMYELYQSVDDPHRFALVESWESKDALEAHRDSPGMAEMRKIAPHLGGPAATFEYEDEPS